MTAILALALSVVSTAQALKVECPGSAVCLPENLEIHLFGTSMGPKQEDFDNVRTAIGSLVSDLKVKKYVHQASGTEGGFSVCMESMNSEAYGTMMQRLKSIQVDRRQTVYEIKHVDDCSK